jgi:hypothetical protein
LNYYQSCKNWLKNKTSNSLQLLKTIKFMPYFSTDGHKTYFGYPDIRFFFRTPWKTIDFEKYSPCHRTTVAHFLNKGKWDDSARDDILKAAVVQLIYKQAAQGKRCSALWMIPSHQRQSLRHGLCIRSKMRISANPISRESRITGIMSF